MKMGMARCARMSHALPKGDMAVWSSEVRPEMGSHCRWMPNSSISSRASQKPGMAKPMNTSTVMALSNSLPCQWADATPMGMAHSRVSTSEATFMPTVSGRRSLILSHTGRGSLDMELPKSSRASRPSHCTYCTCSGLSSPYRASRRLRVSAPASGFMVVCMSVGEPGAR